MRGCYACDNTPLVLATYPNGWCAKRIAVRKDRRSCGDAAERRFDRRKPLAFIALLCILRGAHFSTVHAHSPIAVC